jgi:hypothetical protein
VPRLKGMPTPTPRARARVLALLAALTALCAGILAPQAAAATGPVYSGTGWKALTKDGIYSLSPDPYEIVFADSTARTKLTKYFRLPAAQVTRSVGVPVTVTSTIDTTPTGTCPPYHRIVVHYTYRPMGERGMSEARPCYRISDGSAWGGHLYMDSEYWTTSAWFSTDPAVNEALKRDISTHELGHMLGLDHANTDIDRDGTVEPQECVKGNDGLKPIMCSPNRGLRYPTTTSTGTVPVAYNAMTAGSFTKTFDLPGLRQMLANYRLRQN